jgi:probable rRNA maturation factor
MRINFYTPAGKTRVEKAKVRRLIRKALQREHKQFETVNVILADDAYLQRLNENYFKKKKTTNVISFDLGSVAEIYVSEQQARDKYDLHYYIMHGLLHTIGYDHRTKKEEQHMQEKCEGYLLDE